VSEIDSDPEENEWLWEGISYDSSMSKRFRVCTLDQELLLPPSLQDKGSPFTFLFYPDLS
jgi:hypothetical protein